MLIIIVIICLLLVTDHEAFILPSASTSTSTAPPMAKPGCDEYCGNISIPYPFGIGKRCYHDEWFSINCDNSSHPPKPFLNHSQLNLEVLSVDMSSVIVNSPISSNCVNGEKNITHSIWRSPDLTGSPFLYSWSNELMAVGCANAVLIDGDGKSTVGCTSVCNESIIARDCSMGINCCSTQVPDSLNVYSLSTSAVRSGTELGCAYAFLAYNYTPSYNNISEIININAVGGNGSKYVPLDLRWFFPEPVEFRGCFNDTVETSRRNYSYYDCSCAWYEKGNPYFSDGCQVIEECAKCKENCHWIPNSTTDSSLGAYGCPNKLPTQLKILIIGFGTGGGSLSLLLCSFWLYKVFKRRREIKLKKKFFKQNGGLLLQQQISSTKGTVEKTKIFTSNELVKSTDNFNKNRILGQGGQGTVFKGMLVDGRIVAVKRPKIIDHNQVEQFINEIVILSQINHRNVVKLLGCCLETEVPLLVYEYISNGNLFQLIHDVDNEFPLSWEMRLRIATEAAGALAYLHSASSTPIYHRDIKTTNILLDDKYRAKVSDFGTSRYVSLDQTHLTTLVHGTFGYLDPEYFRSSQFTEKSDVYSFGVVLVELLTGLEPISSTKCPEEKSLVIHFMSTLEDNRLIEILDARVAKEGDQEEIMVVANLACRCLDLNGKKRPTMREVSMELEHFRMSPSSITIGQETLESSSSTRSSLNYNEEATSSSFIQLIPFIDTT